MTPDQVATRIQDIVGYPTTCELRWGMYHIVTRWGDWKFGIALSSRELEEMYWPDIAVQCAAENILRAIEKRSENGGLS